MSENKVFSYTQRDYERSRQEGISKLPYLSNGQWTDYNATDPGIVLLDYVHALADMIQYYQDHQALESFITTARERKNIFRLAYQLGYDIKSAKAARVTCTMTLTNLHQSNIHIDKYSKLMSSVHNIPYITANDIKISPNTSEVEINCVQGEIVHTMYTGTGINKYRTDVEFPADQEYIIEAQDVDTDFIEIYDDLGNIWKRVDKIVFATEGEKAYQVRLNYDNTVSILFGDGERGYNPKETDTLYITYLRTLGDAGRIGAYTLNHFLEPLHDIYGYPVDYSLSNLEASSGGSAPQSDESITELAPGVIKAQGRAVTLADYVNLAKNVDGVKDAIAYDINTAPDYYQPYEVGVLIIPDAGISNSTSLVSSVTEYLSDKVIPPTNLQVSIPTSVPIDIEVTVRQADYIESVDYPITQALTAYFNERSGAIGEDFNPNELIVLIGSIKSVRSIESISPNQRITVNPFSVVTLGNLTINII